MRFGVLTVRLGATLLVLASLCAAEADLGSASIQAAPKATGSEAALPSLKPVVATTSRKLTNCSGACPFRDWVAGSNQDLTVALTGTTPRGVVVPLKPRLVLQPENGGTVVVLSGLSVATAAASKPGEVTEVTVHLDNELSADHYTGALLVNVSSGADPVSAPVDLQVRKGPLWPVLVLLAAVALGAGINLLFGAQPKVRFKRSVQRFRTRLSGLPEAERSVLQELLDDTWRMRGSDFKTAQAHLKALIAGADALQACRNVQDEALRQAMQQSHPQQLTPWVQRIGSATAAVVEAVRSYKASYDDDLGLVRHTRAEFEVALKAKDQIDDLERRAHPGSRQVDPYKTFREAVATFREALSKVSPQATQPAPDLSPLVAEVEKAFKGLEEAHGEELREAAPGEPVAAGVGERVVAGAVALGWPVPAGAVDDTTTRRALLFDATTEVAKWLGPLAALMAALVLLAAGFKTTYLDKATFGAAAGDWLALVLWGLAAYGTHQVLTGLGKSTSSSTS